MSKKLLVALVVASAVALSGCATSPSSVPQTQSPDIVTPTDPDDETDGYIPTVVPDGDSDEGAPVFPPGQVLPVVTAVDHYEKAILVSVTIAGADEGQGSCLATMTRGDKIVTVKKSSIFNISRTECNNMRFPLKSLSPGSWTLSVTFSSDGFSGTSESTTVKVS